MNTATISPEHRSMSVLSKKLLSKDGLSCSLIVLEPDDEAPPFDEHAAHEHVLFVSDGEVNVQIGDINYVLKKDEALHLPKEKPHALINTGVWSKLLLVDLPEREFITPQILSIPGRR